MKKEYIENHTTRRNFIRKGAAMGVTLGTLGTSEVLANDEAEFTSRTELNRQAKAFVSLFNLKYPIVQAPTAGPAGPELAIAIARSGAMGALPLTWRSPQEAYELVQQVKSATDGSFFVNYVLNFSPSPLTKRSRQERARFSSHGECQAKRA